MQHAPTCAGCAARAVWKVGLRLPAVWRVRPRVPRLLHPQQKERNA